MAFTSEANRFAEHNRHLKKKLINQLVLLHNELKANIGIRLNSEQRFHLEEVTTLVNTYMNRDIEEFRAKRQRN